MKLILAFFCIFAVAFTFSQERYSEVDFGDSTNSAFAIFGDTLNDYTVYFTGENHTYAEFNTVFEFKLLTYLHENQGVNHFIFEQSPGLAYIVNEIIFKNKTTHFTCFEELSQAPYYKLIKELYAFNLPLPDEDKIRVHGIDAERFPYFSIYALQAITDSLDISGEEGIVFEQIKAYATSPSTASSPSQFYTDHKEVLNFQFGELSAWQSLKSIINGANTYKTLLNERLGDDSTTFFAIIRSLEVGQEWYMSEKRGDLKSPIIRERFMLEAFDQVYATYPEGKFYGQFGRCHLHKDAQSGRCYNYYMNAIANRINDKEGPLKNKVLVIPIFYKNSHEFDAGVIKSMQLDAKFTSGETSYIIDLAYKKGDHSIVGFYKNLPFVIICNAQPDHYLKKDDYWESIQDIIHIGGYYSYANFTGLRKFNNALVSKGYGAFNSEWNGYSFAIDYLELNSYGTRMAFNYFPKVSNGDNFTLQGSAISAGLNYPMGNKFVMAAAGLDVGYGRMILIEEQTALPPNLIQVNGKNYVRYTNDFLTLDPNVEFRLMLPLISFNIRAGYALDVSGKYWVLNEKIKDFTKTSFSSFYAQVGVSLNIKTN